MQEEKDQSQAFSKRNRQIFREKLPEPSRHVCFISFFNASCNASHSELSCSQSTVSRDLEKMGWSKKILKAIPRTRNKEENLLQRHDWSLGVLHFCIFQKPNLHFSEINKYDDEEVLYLDECGFNTHTLETRGWAPPGESPCLTNKFTFKLFFLCK